MMLLNMSIEIIMLFFTTKGFLPQGSIPKNFMKGFHNMLHHVFGIWHLSKLSCGLQSAMQCNPAACNLTDELRVILIIKEGFNRILVLLKVVSEAARKPEDKS